MKDLVILAADKDLEHALRGLIGRSEALGIRPIDYDVFVHPEHDPACAIRGVEFLARFAEQYSYALLMFDQEGSGRESTAIEELQISLNANFSSSDWGERAKAIVLSPELEAWIWSASPVVDEIAGWKDRNPGLRPWLFEQGWLESGEIKPRRPKEAFIAALRKARKPRSASLYEQIASRVSLQRCKDNSFTHFKNVLRAWFPRARIGLEG